MNLIIKNLLLITSCITILSILNPQALMSQNVICNFNSSLDLKRWIIVNDDVMGGVSSGNLNINKEGNGVFEGSISTDNNGGFSSMRFNFNKVFINSATNFKIKIKGDGKVYQFRIKANRDDYYSYVFLFETSGKWEIITIPLDMMYASFRGRKLNMQNFNNNYFTQISFLVGNKKDEKFKLLIDDIILM